MKTNRIYLLLISLVGLGSCKETTPPEPPPLPAAQRTVIEYVIATDQSYPAAQRYINELEAAFDPAGNERHIVYLYPPAKGSTYAPADPQYDERPRLLLIARDQDPEQVGSTLLKAYSRSQAPGDPEVLQAVQADALRLAPGDYYTIATWQNPDVPPTGRTVIEYMIADNNLYPYAVQNINDMETAWAALSDNEKEGRMVVYLHPVAAASRWAPTTADYDDTPRLLLISGDRNDPNRPFASRVLKTYSREQNPTDPEVMARVVTDAMALAPGASYGLAFWSHGAGWLPAESYQPLRSVIPAWDDAGWSGSKLAGIGEPKPTSMSGTNTDNQGITSYSFGISSSFDNSEMEIDAMSRALSGFGKFDFILFDACHMACIELAWEFRDRTDYLIASAAEVLGAGFPYREVLKPMLSPGAADVEEIARTYFDYYNEQSGAYRTATVSVVKTSGLPTLAEAVKRLSDTGLPEGATGLSPAAQQFGRTYTSFNGTFYDLGDLVHRTWSGGAYTEAVGAFDRALAAAVPYAATTPWILEGQSGAIRVLTHCGLSSYLPRASTPVSLEAYRTRFGWSEASGMGALAR